LCGHDVTDTLLVRFAPRRGRDVCHCRTSVAFQADDQAVPPLVVALLARLHVSNPPEPCPARAPSRPYHIHTHIHMWARLRDQSQSHTHQPCCNLCGSPVQSVPVVVANTLCSFASPVHCSRLRVSGRSPGLTGTCDGQSCRLVVVSRQPHTTSDPDSQSVSAHMTSPSHHG
jgi:hypothetical protein